MENIIENVISQMDTFLVNNSIEGQCIWDKGNGEILLNVEDILLSQIHAFEDKFHVTLSSQINGYNGFCFDMELDNLLRGRIFQTEIIQEDCKGDGIKLYRKNDKTFPSKTHPNTYLGVFETHRQVSEVISTYTNLLLLGKHEDVVFNVMKHEEIGVIKKEYKRRGRTQ